MKKKIAIRKKLDKRLGYPLVTSIHEEYYLPVELFGIIKLQHITTFLKSVVDETFFQFSEVGGIQFGPLLGSPFDGIEDLSEKDVEIGLDDEEIRIPKLEFFQLCSEFIERVKESIDVFELENLGLVDSVWRETIFEMGNQIDQKIQEIEF